MLENGILLRYFPGEKHWRNPRANSKRHLQKIMFLAVNARPRPEYDFDGRLGIWRTAKNGERSQNRKPKGKNPGYKKGDPFREDFKSVDAEKYRFMVLQWVMPAIREKPVSFLLPLQLCAFPSQQSHLRGRLVCACFRMWWFHKNAHYRNSGGVRVRCSPKHRHAIKCPEAGNPIYLQQDGASPHTAAKNRGVFKTGGGNDFSTATSPPKPRREWRYVQGFMIIVVTQAARSPDLNVNDLGFFCSFKTDVRSHPDFVGGDKDAYERVVLVSDAYRFHFQ